MTVTVADWGATLLSAEVPLADGSVRHPLLGCAKLEDYARRAAFLGASVGRYANRIGNSRFPLDGQLVTVTPSNDAGHQLHGGPEGFDKRRWRIVRADEQEALFALTSPDGDQGFPGTLQATAHYRLTDDNRIVITYRATVDQPCPVNMTNHVYFNLDGDRATCASTSCRSSPIAICRWKAMVSRAADSKTSPAPALISASRKPSPPTSSRMPISKGEGL